MNNVLINGRTAVHAGSGGTLVTVDVCNTKVGKHTVPIPYTNVAQSTDSSKTASSVLINGNPACTKDSVFSKSKGDEPGNRNGVKSGTRGKEASFLSASANVQIEGVAAARALDQMVSNKQNTAPSALVQPGGSSSSNSTKQPDSMNNSEQPHRVAVQQDGNFSLYTGYELIEEDEA